MAATRNSRPSDLPARVGDFLAARIVPTDRFSIGLSGGCDSVVLLHALVACGLKDRLQAIHVHHGLSPNADAWADFCADYCRRLDVPLVVHRVVVEANAGCGLEAAAREARYAVFAEAAGDILLLAHHRGDQAETVLFNLLRGCGVTGAAGIPVERQFGRCRLLRPLLGLARSEIEAYARATDLTWIDDESNDDTALTRNYLRHEALVALAQRFPAAESALAQAAANFAEAGDLLDDLAALDWQCVEDGESAWVAELRKLPLPRLKNLLRHRLRFLGWQVPVAARLDEFARQLLAAAPDRHPELQLPDGKMRVAQRRLHWLAGK